MPRPAPIVRLLRRLAPPRPIGALAALGAVIALLTLATSSSADVPAAGPGECHVEQTWSAGPAERREVLRIFGFGSGLWTAGDGRGEEHRRRFLWAVDGDAIRFEEPGHRRRIPFRLEQRGSLCVLTFERPPLRGGAHVEFEGQLPPWSRGDSDGE